MDLDRHHFLHYCLLCYLHLIGCLQQLPVSNCSCKNMFLMQNRSIYLHIYNCETCYVSPCFSFRLVSLTPGRTLGKIVSQTILRTARWPQGPVLMKTVSWSYSPAGVRKPLCSRCLNQFDFFSLNLKRKGLLQLSSDLKSKMQWRCQRTAMRTIMP